MRTMSGPRAIAPTVVIALSVAVTALVMLVNDLAFDGFVAWNLAPIVVAFLALALARWARKPQAGIGTPAVVFCAVTSIVVAVTHLDGMQLTSGGCERASRAASLIRRSQPIPRFADKER